jgi:hypothetical protein
MAAIEDVSLADFKAQTDTNFYGARMTGRPCCLSCGSSAAAISSTSRRLGAAMANSRPV